MAEFGLCPFASAEEAGEDYVVLLSAVQGPCDDLILLERAYRSHRGEVHAMHDGPNRGIMALLLE